MLRLKAQLDWRKEKRLIRILTIQNVKEVEYYACNNWMNGLYHHKLLILPPCPCIYRGTICNDTVLITFNKITHNMMWDDYNNRCTEIKTLCNSGGLYVYSWINVSAVICFWLIQWLKNQPCKYLIRLLLSCWSEYIFLCSANIRWHCFCGSETWW